MPDGGAVFGYPFTLDQLSTIEHFHPNVTGQAVLAEVTWEAGFSWMAGATSHHRTRKPRW